MTITPTTVLVAALVLGAVLFVAVAVWLRLRNQRVSEPDWETGEDLDEVARIYVEGASCGEA